MGYVHDSAHSTQAIEAITRDCGMHENDKMLRRQQTKKNDFNGSALASSHRRGLQGIMSVCAEQCSASQAVPRVNERGLAQTVVERGTCFSDPRVHSSSSALAESAGHTHTPPPTLSPRASSMHSACRPGRTPRSWPASQLAMPGAAALQMSDARRFDLTVSHARANLYR